MYEYRFADEELKHVLTGLCVQMTRNNCTQVRGRFDVAKSFYPEVSVKASCSEICEIDSAKSPSPK